MVRKSTIMEQALLKEKIQGFIKNKDLLEFLDKLYKLNYNDALDLLYLFLKKQLLCHEVYIYNNKIKQKNFFNNKRLDRLISNKVLKKLLAKLKNETVDAKPILNKAFNIILPNYIKTFYIERLRVDSKSQAMLMVINPENKDIKEFTELTSILYKIIIEKENVIDENHKRPKELIQYNFSSVIIGEYIIDSKLSFLKTDKKLFDFLGIEKDEEFNLLSFLDYKDIKFLLKIREELYKQKDVEFTIKVNRKNNIPGWLKVSGKCIGLYKKKPIYLVIISDVTEQNQLELALKTAQERSYFATTTSRDIIFEYDIVNDLFIKYDSFNTSSTSPEYMKNYLENYKKDYPKPTSYQLKWITLLSGIPIEKFNLKFDVENKEKHIWVLVQSKIIYSDDHPKKVVGRLTNITERKLKEDQIIADLKVDDITGLYNREHGEYLVKNYLERPNPYFALLLIDLDGFKTINDKYGYILGNYVLREFAQFLKENISNAIVYRYSKDHFVAVIRESNMHEAREIANKICERTYKVFENIDEKITLTCSIGITDYSDSTNYEELLKSADCALQYIKANGKGFAACYYSSLEENINTNHLSLDRANELIYVKDDMLTFTLEILKKTNDIFHCFNILSTIYKKKYNLENISFLTLDKNNLICNNLLSYKDEEIEFKITKNDLKHFITGFNINGVLTDSSFVEYLSEDAKAFFTKHLRSLVIHDFKFKQYLGVMILEHQDKQHIWNDEDIKTFHKINNIISIYLANAFSEIEIDHQKEMMSKLSHEIRTPLNGIRGMLRIAQNAVDDKDKLVSALEKISVSSRYLLTLVNNVLDFSRILKGKMRISRDSFELDSLVEDVKILMEIQAESRNINFKVIKNYDKHQVFGDSLRLNQVLINIVGNAFKFTPENGYVFFKVTELDSDDKTVNIRFTVKDNGIGISEENIERIFAAYEQEKPQTTKDYGGSGLGLAISESLVKMMGGKIGVKSKVNEGSEFFFTIPFPKVKVNDSKDINENYVDAFKGANVLICDDNEINLQVIHSLLEQFGCNVDACSNGEKAVKQYLSKDPFYYDVILIDIRMPVMDGFKATKAIRRSGNKDALTIPIIAMTANAFEEEKEQSFASGMDGHLIKPMDIKILYKELKKLIKR